jgi:hypothetical protein
MVRSPQPSPKASVGLAATMLNATAKDADAANFHISDLMRNKHQGALPTNPVKEEINRADRTRKPVCSIGYSASSRLMRVYPKACYFRSLGRKLGKAVKRCRGVKYSYDHLNRTA